MALPGQPPSENGSGRPTLGLNPQHGSSREYGHAVSEIGNPTSPEDEEAEAAETPETPAEDNPDVDDE